MQAQAVLNETSIEMDCSEFPESKGNPHLTWAVSPTGDWSADNARGRELARKLLAHMRGNEAPNALGVVIKAMIACGAYTGVEVGFLTTIASAAISCHSPT